MAVKKSGTLGTYPAKLISGAKAKIVFSYEINEFGSIGLCSDLYSLDKGGRRHMLFNTNQIWIPVEYRSKVMKLLQKLEDESQ